MIKYIKKTLKISSEKDDIVAFENIYETTNHFVRSVSYWMLRDQFSEDIVQDVYLKAWRSRRSFKGEADIKTWLHRITINTVTDYYRKENRKKHFIKDAEDDFYTTDVQERELINISISQLNLKEREAFILVYKMGYTHEESALLMKIPLGTFKSRVFTAKEKFIKHYNKEEAS